MKRDLDINMNDFLQEELIGKEKALEFQLTYKQVALMEEELAGLKKAETERSKMLNDLSSQRDRVALSIAQKLAKVKEVETTIRIKVSCLVSFLSPFLSAPSFLRQLLTILTSNLTLSLPHSPLHSIVPMPPADDLMILCVHQDLEMSELKKIRREVQRRIYDYEKLYEMVKNQRNKFVNLIQV